MRWTSRAAITVLLSFAAAAPAQADSLRAYDLTVKPTALEDLARAGFDVTEGVENGHITVAATRTQAARLRKLGFKPRLRRMGAARVAADYGPSGGYDVYRPYARQAYDLDGDEVPNLVEEMKALASAHPGITKLVKIGQTAGGPDDPESEEDDDYTASLPIYAVKVSRDAKSEPDGSKPAVLYSSTQHAREWLSTETNRRLLKLLISNYGETGTAVDVNGDPIDGVSADELTQLVNTRELWFVLVCNPNGYDYTFESPDTRLWRKNLRDNNGDGALSTVDGVDPNRNFATHWGLDNEGSSHDTSSETYRGPAPASEPETKALDGLMDRVSFEWNNNFHTFGELLLYPFGWQTDTHAADDPIFRAIAGSNENPAIPGFDPGVGAELYITNGDTNDHAYTRYDTLSFTPELQGGDETAEAGAGGFIFQDVEADVQEEFERQLEFSLDMARSAEDPANPDSHLHNTTPNFELDTFDVSYGSPQTVQVSAKRELGPVTLHWEVDGGPEQTAATEEWTGGSRYGDVGDVYYHRLRGEVTGASPGDTVKVWFEAADAKSKAFTYTLESNSGDPVLILNGENYSGGSPAYAPPEPTYLSAYTSALDALGIAYDVWDIDARGLKAPDPLGVLGHYEAVLWFTGDDFVTRHPGQPGGTGAAKVANDTVLAVRDHLNEGGRLLLTGSQSGDQYFTGFEYSQFGEPVANTESGYCNSIDVEVADGCIPLSNDFFQYWLGGYGYVSGGGSDGENAFPVHGFGPLAGTDFAFDPEGNQAAAGTALVTSSVLDPAIYPTYAQTSSAAEYVRPGAAPYDPFTGDWYLYSGTSDVAFRRLGTTVDLTGKTGGGLDFMGSFDTEPDWDFVFVEARTVGEDDWTTLPITDDEGNVLTSDSTGASCASEGSHWNEIHPWMDHYQTVTDADSCDPTGTTGSWNALTGNSHGWQHLNVDLSAYDGQQVEVFISYAQDWATTGLGVFVDDVRTSAGDTTLSETSFETDLGTWAVSGPPAGTENNASDWARSQAAFDEAPVVVTPQSWWFTFGLEGIDTAANRNKVLAAALKELGVTGPATATPTPTATATATPTATATATPSPTATPAPVRRLRVRRTPVRATRKGKVPFTVKCVNLGGNRCTGAAHLFRPGRKKAVAKRSFRIPMDKWTTRRMRIFHRPTLRRLKRRGSMRFVLRVRAFNQEYGTFTKRVRITVFAP